MRSFVNRVTASGMAVLMFCALTFGQVRKAEAIAEIYMIIDGVVWVQQTIPGTGGWIRWVPLGNLSGLGTAVGGGPAAGGTVAGGTVAGTLGILAVAAVIAVGATIAIDCAAHGECIWTTVNAAGGFGVVSGWSPNPNAAPIPGAVTVSCSDPRSLVDQCRTSSLQNTITGYSSWFGGAYWTCGEVWANGATTGSAEWVNALSTCNAQLNACVVSTSQVCVANNIPRPDLQLMAVAAPPIEAGDEEEEEEEEE